MISLIANARALIEQRRREAARAYLLKVAPEHLLSYPQLCCYSFDDIAKDVNIDGRFDLAALDLLAELVAPIVKGRTILDIGANIGNHAVVFAGIAKKVIAFEPHPVTFQLLNLNMRNLGNVVTLNLGASDTRADLRAVSPARNRGATAISDRAAQASEEEWTLSVAPVDSLTELQGAEIALIKLDVEGHEAPALRGARETIGKHKPIVVIEQNWDAIRDGKSEALEILREYGCTRFYSIEVAMPWRTPQALPSVLRKIGRGVESLLFGPVEYSADIAPVTQLEPRSYPMLIATFEPLAFDRGVALQSE